MADKVINGTVQWDSPKKLENLIEKLRNIYSYILPLIKELQNIVLRFFFAVGKITLLVRPNSKWNRL